MEHPALKIENLHAYHGTFEILKGISMDVKRGIVLAVMGPSGCGKTTFIRCLNRMHELTPQSRMSGKIFLNDEDISNLYSIIVRRKIGMVFQRPNPFPNMSIYENVLAGYRLNGIRLDKNKRNETVEWALTQSALWNEVKDKLHQKGSFLSGGQQQRLCIARALAVKPDILLLDEPTSALDPKATAKIEELIHTLKRDVTVIMVTHNIGQAARVSDETAFLYVGELVEMGPTRAMFTVPKDKRTEEYLAGHFG